ncbi:MAG: amidohydrolase family protein [Prolixibacteraceae bacterium]
MDLLLLNIKELVQAGENPHDFLAGQQMASVSTIENAFLLISDEMIVDYGSMKDLDGSAAENSDMLMEIDCKGRMVFPSFCDPDSHLLYPFGEFPNYSRRHAGGEPYSIEFSNSFVRLHEMSIEEIYVQALDHLKEVVRKGTGAIEIKSGYGLEAEDELKLLQVIRKLKMTTPLVVKSTFLGSHTYHERFRRSPAKYLDHILDILPAISQDELADNLDLYYDRQFLSRSESETLLLAGLKEGLNVKIHSDELGLNRLNVNNLKVCLDILDQAGPLSLESIDQMITAEIFPVIMPGASFFHNLNASSARDMIDSGLPLAIATDFDPGSMPSCDMKFMQSLACIKYGMLPEEAINASTINSAFLMGIGHGYGTITKGKAANVFVTRKIPSYTYLPYGFSSDLIEMVILDGEIH